MKLREMMTDGLVFSMTQKLLSKKERVKLDLMQHARDHSVWNYGDVLSVEHMPEVKASPGVSFAEHYLVTINVNLIGPRKVKIKPEVFARLKLRRSPEGWILSDRKPEADDDI
jgi:hypothetical protein